MSGNHGLLHFEKYIKIGILLNITFVIIEIIFGIFSNSIALITDAGHNFSDVLTLLLAWFAAWLMKKQSTHKFTYGYKKGSIYIALINSVILLFALGGITWEAFKRLNAPEPVEGNTIIIVSAVGIVINGLTAFMFLKGRKDDLNIKSAFLHMLTDALVSLGVLISGIIILITQLYLIDPVISLIIVAVILYGSWGVFRDSVKMSMDAVPEEIETSAVLQYFQNIKCVDNIHDLHIWPISTSHTALTVHLVLNCSADNKFLDDITRELHDKFGIDHCTIQVENSGAETICRLEKCTTC
jgi:cobalt-zinc-cadmium efflux system protein